MKEGKAGIKIGTLSCGNLVGNFEFTDWRSSRFEIKGNDLYLNQAYMFDYEKQAIHTDILGWGNWNSWSENLEKLRFSKMYGNFFPSQEGQA